jgi:hypothetical protein
MINYGKKYKIERLTQKSATYILNTKLSLSYIIAFLEFPLLCLFVQCPKNAKAASLSMKRQQR